MIRHRPLGLRPPLRRRHRAARAGRTPSRARPLRSQRPRPPRASITVDLELDLTGHATAADPARVGSRRSTRGTLGGRRASRLRAGAASPGRPAAGTTSISRAARQTAAIDTGSSRRRAEREARRRTRWFATRSGGGGAARDDWRSTPAVAASGSTDPIERAPTTASVCTARPLRPAAAAGEHVIGLRRALRRVDQRGTALDSVVFEQYKSQGAERQDLPADAVRARGRRRRLGLPRAHVAAGLVRRRAPRRSDSPLDRGRNRPAATDAPLLDIALYDGTPTEVLDALPRRGRAARRSCPTWVFRLWASGNEWNTQAEVMRQVALHREHEHPGRRPSSSRRGATRRRSPRSATRSTTCAQTAARCSLADFTFPADGAWPDPKGMVDELHAQRHPPASCGRSRSSRCGRTRTGQAARDAAAAIARRRADPRARARRRAAPVPQPRLVVPARRSCPT